MQRQFSAYEHKKCARCITERRMREVGLPMIIFIIVFVSVPCSVLHLVVMDDYSQGRVSPLSAGLSDSFAPEGSFGL